jgi:hypothetical protein
MIEPMENHHADCQQCCQIGRCHFCTDAGKLAAQFEKDGTLYHIRLCQKHFAWAASDPRAPEIDFSESGWTEMPSEPLRHSESFQQTLRNMTLHLSGS